MNAKKAKALRKILRNLEKMQPEGAQPLPEISYSENTRNRKIIVMNDLDKEGNLVEKKIPIAAGTITVDQRSMRGVYKNLKKAMNSDGTKTVEQPKPATAVAQPVLTVGSPLAHTAEDLNAEPVDTIQA